MRFERRSHDPCRIDAFDSESLDVTIFLPALYPPYAVPLNGGLDELQHRCGEVDAGIAVPGSLALAFHNRRDLLCLVLNKFEQVPIRRSESDHDLWDA